MLKAAKHAFAKMIGYPPSAIRPLRFVRTRENNRHTTAIATNKIHSPAPAKPFHTGISEHTW